MKSYQLFMLGLGLIYNIWIQASGSEKQIQPIEDVLKQFNRPFTVLELNRPDKAISLFASSQFIKSVFVLALPPNHEPIIECIYDMSLKRNVVVLSRPLNEELISRLGDCEHFDVVFIGSFFEQFPQCSSSLLDALLTLGQYTIFEGPLLSNGLTEEEYNQWLIIKQRLMQQGGKYLGNFTEGNKRLYIIEQKKRFLKRKSWVLPPLAKQSHRIFSDFRKKILYKSEKDMKGHVTYSTWIPGINLITFIMLDGMVPSREEIKKALLGLQYVPHSDWMINNMIVQGKEIQLIDFKDPRRQKIKKDNRKSYVSKKRMQQHFQILDLDDKEEIAKRLNEGLD